MRLRRLLYVGIETDGRAVLGWAIFVAARQNKRWQPQECRTTLGRAPHAFVVLKAGANRDGNRAAKLSRDHLAHSSVPQKIQFVSELQNSHQQGSEVMSLAAKLAISRPNEYIAASGIASWWQR